MKYDPIKRGLGNIFNRTPWLRIIFYRLLDLLLLRAWHVHRELRLWKKAHPNATHILDAGAGFGQHTYWMHRHNKQLHIMAVDVKDEQVHDCNHFFEQIQADKVHFEVADLTQFVEENTYDLCLSVDVMEHIEEDVLVFKNICKSLKAGGMLLISTPSDKGGSDVHGDSEESFIEEHVRDGYNMQEIIDKLHSAGFSRAEALYSYGTPGKISWRLSMKYPILMLGASKLFYLVLPVWYLVTYPLCFILNWMDTTMTHSEGTGLIVKAWK